MKTVLATAILDEIQLELNKQSHRPKTRRRTERTQVLLSLPTARRPTCSRSSSRMTGD